MRILIADMKNAHFKYPGGPVAPEDIFKLSYDTVATGQDRKLSEADWNKRIPKKKK
jgi:hypothetical protein